MANTTITYAELVKRLDVVKLFNKAPELDEDIYSGLENGDLATDDSNDYIEIFQWYLIGANDAEYLKDHTDELIFYSDVLDEYVWGVTHFGTPWDSVNLEFKENNQMTTYDFVVTQNTKTTGVYAYRLSVEKVAVLDDDVTLARWLAKEDVADKDIGLLIERLETLPYGDKAGMVNGRNGKILIEQI